MMKKANTIFVLVLMMCLGTFLAHGSGMDESPVQTGLVYGSSFLFGGYRFVDLSGDSQVAEYDYLHDSILLGGEQRLTLDPHRFHLDLGIVNRHDYSGDLSYAYKDLIVFRGINSTLYHNLNNIGLTDPDTSTPSPGVDVRDAGEDYGIRTGISSLNLRFKTPDFPFHTYFKGDLIEKKGTRQQRFMSGAAYFNEIVRASRSRDTDWRTESITVGANSHFGPVEIDYFHEEKRFDAGRDAVLFDTYSYSGFGPGFRQPGTYPHNMIPDLRGSSDTVRIHTSYTGRLVAAATFSMTDRENRGGETTADYVSGSGEVMWMPAEKLTLFFRYLYRDRDVNNPDSVTITDLVNPLNTYSYVVKPSISSVSNRYSGTARYRLLRGVTLRANFTHSDIRRKDADLWEIPERTIANSTSLSADMRIRKSVKLQTTYTHTLRNNPATNIQPDSSDEGRVSVSWIPLPWINTLLTYGITDEKRNDLHFTHTDTAEKRDVQAQRLLGSVTILVINDLSFTTSYSYLDSRTRQDIVYHDGMGTPFVDPFVPYDTKSHSYAFDIQYVPHAKISLSAGVSHNRSRGVFHPDTPSLTQPVSIASFSELKAEETTYTLTGNFRFRHGLSSGFEYSYSDLNDILDNPDDDVEDGRFHLLLVTISKDW